MAEENKKKKTEEEASVKEKPKKEHTKKSGDSELKKKLEAAEKEIVELKDQYLRLNADYDNFRKRTQREKTALYTSVAADTVEKILPVMDSIGYAVAYKEADAEKILKGLEMIEKQLEKSLEDIGVKEVDYGTFDPTIHEAVGVVEDDTLPENSVAQVLRKGYKLGDVVIRPATVKVKQ